MEKGLIFDWSGTLADNFSGFCQVVSWMFEALGSEPLTPEALRQNYTTPYMKFWNRYFPDLAKEKQDKMFAEYFVRLGDPELFPGVKDTIQSLHQAGHGIFVVSSDPLTKLLPSVERSGLAQYLDEVIGEDQDKDGSAKMLMTKYALDPGSSYFVGDCVGDIEAGKAAGLRTIGLTWGFEDKDRLARSNPDYLFDDIAQIKGLFAADL